MKRSEMVKSLEKRLQDKWGYDMVLHPNELSTILKVLEDLGMEPPSYNVGAPLDSMDCAGNLIQYNDYYLNEWEPEE